MFIRLRILFFCAVLVSPGMKCQTGEHETADNFPGSDSITTSQPVPAEPISWIDSAGTTLLSRFPLTTPYTRLSQDSASFGQYLRQLNLLPDGSPVMHYDGSPKYYQQHHHAILDIDVGTRDLQQCADAVMRLRGEYLFAQRRYAEISFNFLGDGKPQYYTKYAGADRTYGKFRKYMNYIFSYANTESLGRELTQVPIDSIRPGDTFIDVRPGAIGHAITVMDMMVNQATGKKYMMLSQSYMPAQSIHILRNPTNPDSPWYEIGTSGSFETPEWVFDYTDLRRFL